MIFNQSINLWFAAVFESQIHDCSFKLNILLTLISQGPRTPLFLIIYKFKKFINLKNPAEENL